MRNVRNFWFKATVDGKKVQLASGPRNSSGGMVLHLYQRDKGESKRVLSLVCSPGKDGMLDMEVHPDPKATIYPYADGDGFTIVTER